MKKTNLVWVLGVAVAFSASPLRAAAAVSPDLEEWVSEVSAYHSGQSLEALRKLEEKVRASLKDPNLRAEVEAALMELLGPDSSYEARSFAAKQLAILGSEKALPAIGQLLEEPQTVGLACLALSAYPPGVEAVLAAMDGGPERTIHIRCQRGTANGATESHRGKHGLWRRQSRR